MRIIHVNHATHTINSLNNYTIPLKGKIMQLKDAKIGDTVEFLNDYSAVVTKTDELQRRYCVFDDSSQSWFSGECNVELIEPKHTIIQPTNTRRISFSDVNVGETFFDNGKEWKKTAGDTATRTVKYVPNHQVTVDRPMLFNELKSGDEFEYKQERFLRASTYNDAVHIDPKSGNYGDVRPFHKDVPVILLKRKYTSTKF